MHSTPLNKKSSPRAFSYFYNLALILFALSAIPKLVFQRLKYKKTFTNKSGNELAFISKTERPLVWIHAVSVGETKAIAEVASLLKREYPFVELLVTNTTETGHAEAKRSLPFADHYHFLPFDLSWIIQPVVKKLKPTLLLLSESDYWYHFVQAAKATGAHIAILNGKISEKSAHRYGYLGRWLKTFFSDLDLICVQSPRYAERFLSLGIPEKKIVVTGNLKLDFKTPPLAEETVQDWQKRFDIQPKDLIIVAGSTHASEETLLLDTFQALAPEFPDLKLMIVPRRPERFEEVRQIMQSYPFSFATFSESNAKTDSPRLLLIDAMGHLNTCYRLSTIAVVCGSFTTKVGGHNILEPSTFGKPVVFGPYMHTQMDFVNLVQSHEAGIQASESNLIEVLQDLLRSKEKREILGENGRRLVLQTQGASQRTFDLLKTHFHFSRSLALHKKIEKE